MFLRNNESFPKSINKAIRYIKQDAPLEQIEEIRIQINHAIEQRIKNESRCK